MLRRLRRDFAWRRRQRSEKRARRCKSVVCVAAAVAVIMCPWKEEENPVGNTHAASDDDDSNEVEEEASAEGAAVLAGKAAGHQAGRQQAGPLKNQATATAPAAPAADTLFLFPPSLLPSDHDELLPRPPGDVIQGQITCALRGGGVRCAPDGGAPGQRARASSLSRHPPPVPSSVRARSPSQSPRPSPARSPASCFP